MNYDSELIAIGRFGRPHGIKGLITVHSFTDPYDNILQYADWQVYLNKQWQSFKPIHLEIKGKLILAQLEGYNEREQVAQLTNKEIVVSRHQLPQLEQGEYYWHELLGMQVINEHSILLGVVKKILPTGSNDVLVIEGSKRYLIPYLPGQFIFKVDLSKRIIHVDWEVDF